MAVSSIKLRMLCMMKILLEKTDEQHVMSAVDIAEALKMYDMSIDRKTVYSDIETLQKFGIDIIQLKGSNAGYYVGKREFELPELKLLVDAVQASKFITTRKSRELIKKLEGLASEHDAKELQRDVYIYNRPKTGNETIYYNVDQIHRAIRDNMQIHFQYTEWTAGKELRLKKDGEYYVISPWALTWDDENYYLIAHDENADAIRHYRVDKMQHLSVAKDARLGKEKFRDFDLAAFAKKTFSMYGGRDEEVTLLCHNSLAGVILDRFGKDVILIPKDEEHFQVKVLVAVSSQFFGWVTGVGVKMKIAKPESVRQEYREYLQRILDE